MARCDERDEAESLRTQRRWHVVLQEMKLKEGGLPSLVLSVGAVDIGYRTRSLAAAWHSPLE